MPQFVGVFASLPELRPGTVELTRSPPLESALLRMKELYGVYWAALALERLCWVTLQKEETDERPMTRVRDASQKGQNNSRQGSRVISGHL